MARPAVFPEEECFNVYWKIKNFSYCRGKITSPEFSIFGCQYYLQLHRSSVDLECMLILSSFKLESCDTREISFLTCDGSQEFSTSNGSLLVPKDAIFGDRRSSFLPEDTLTVRLRRPTESERGRLLICSQIGVKRAHFLWTFQNFSGYEGSTKKSAEKSELYGDIELNFKPVSGCDAGRQFCIEISRTGGETCYCTLRVAVLDTNGKALNEVSDEFGFEKKDGQQVRGFPGFFKKSELLADNNLLLPQDSLSLKCHFTTSLGTVTDRSADVSYCENATSLTKELRDLQMNFKGKEVSGSISDLPVDLKGVLKDGTLFDASLHIGTEIIHVHKIILSARSAVFKAMFTSDTKEARDNTVIIEDLDLETVRKLVLYMYTDTTPDGQWEDIAKLYFAADKYEVLSLKKKCASLLQASLSTSNVHEALVFADLHQDEGLKTAVIDFISENDAAVFDSEEWKELGTNNPSLALNVMSGIYRNKYIKLK